VGGLGLKDQVSAAKEVFEGLLNLFRAVERIPQQAILQRLEVKSTITVSAGFTSAGPVDFVSPARWWVRRRPGSPWMFSVESTSIWRPESPARLRSACGACYPDICMR